MLAASSSDRRILREFQVPERNLPRRLDLVVEGASEVLRWWNGHNNVDLVLLDARPDLEFEYSVAS
jgi:hypothetical protein